MAHPQIDSLARTVIAKLTASGLTIATVESCTGGLIAGALTEIPGSSAAVYGGFVTYSNSAKSAMVGVPEALLVAHGAVSEPVARAMAEGGRTASGADIVIAVTGIAGPGGGSAVKPVGLVHFACAAPGGTTHRVERFGDLGRAQVRAATILVALQMVLDAQAP
ncbi:CinA family protein [Arsenicitalea aurantiaca]|uniref:CinA family protein n=1 Tax=Arsenicitalea aurantiaca TaxID=1783274 RepID=A0A433XFU6_9HYPH|nr:CinA family protein [Arsenicitalea aurantiaca]RUT32884.1 CinA family protein [Arsenicitalea aurantiaca]